MRHRKRTAKLGMKSQHRRSTLANLVCSLIEHNRIRTTIAKAKVARSKASVRARKSTQPAGAARQRSRRAPGDIGRTEYESGLRIVTEQMPGMRSVALGVWVDVGSRDERPAINGASHFLEHLLFKGTKKRTARQIAEAPRLVTHL